MNFKRFFTLAGCLWLLLNSHNAFSSELTSGFSKEEYKELMLVSVRSVASETYSAKFPAPKDFKMIYQSKPLALDNLWDLWIHSSKPVAAISLRGTTENSVSWLENFYAAMVPAKGVLPITENKKFEYNLADDPKAGVHVGWLIATAYLSDEILPRIDSLYKTGIKDFYVVGHSQGGAIAYLLTAHLYNLRKTGKLPADLTFKTYCSAAPKPGNLYFAYQYEINTQKGWAYNVVNTADWVPEVPISIQTLDDFNNVNPFNNAEDIIKKQKFPQRLVLKRVFNKLNKPTKKAQKNYQKYLGKMASKLVKEAIPGYITPEYFNSNHYVRTGNIITLFADSNYYSKFPDNPDNIFCHHFHDAYLYLIENY